MRRKNKNIILILIGISLSIIPIYKVLMGGYLNPIDLNFSFNIQASYHNNLYVWSSNNSGQINIIPLLFWLPVSFFSYMLSFAMPLWVINKLWYIMPLFITFCSVFYLSKVLAFLFCKREKILCEQNTYFIAFVSAVLFLISKPTVLNSSYGWPLKYFLVLSATFFMIAFYIKCNLLSCQKKPTFFILAVLFSLLSVGTLQLYIFGIIFIFIFSVSDCLFYRRKSFKKVVFELLFFLMITCVVNLWLILPLLNFLLSRYQYYTINILQQIEMSSFNNIIRVLLFENQIAPRPFNFNYLSSSLDVIYYFFLWGIFGSIILWDRRSNKAKMLLLIPMIVFIFFAAGNSKPFGSLFILGVKNIPLFTMFRTVNKVNGFIAFLLIFGTVYFIYRFLNKYYKNYADRKIKLFCVFFTLIIYSIIISPGFFSGNFKGSLKTFEVPQDYYELKRYFRKYNSGDRLLVLPFPGWLSNFLWHNELNNIHNPIRTVIVNPIIYDEFLDRNINQIQRILIHEFYAAGASKEVINNLSNLLNIKIVLVQNDQINQVTGASLGSINSTLHYIHKNLNLNQRFHLEKSFGKLDLYKISDEYFLPHIYASDTPIIIEGDIDTLVSLVETEYISGKPALFFNAQEQNQELRERKDIPKLIYGDDGWELLKPAHRSSLPPSARSSHKAADIAHREEPEITFRKINPTKYEVKVEGAREPFWLVFSESFHEKWKLYEGKRIKEKGKSLFGEIVGEYPHLGVKEARHQMKFTPQDVRFLFEEPLDAEHHLVNGYANSWYIEPEELELGEDFVLTIYFFPQSLFYLGLGISGLTLLTCVIYLGYSGIKKKRATRNS
jgi:hypothetical protein